MRDLARLASTLAVGALLGCSSAPPTDPLLNWDYSQKSGDDGGTTPTSSGSSSSSSGGTTDTDGGSSSGGSGGSSGTAISGGSGSSGGTVSSSGGSTASGTVPCDVATVLAAKCTGCHSDPPVNSAIAGLVTYSDLMKTAIEDPTKNEAELALARMQSSTSPMPPATFNDPASASDIATVQSWINAGYPSGSCAGDAGLPVSSAVDVFAKATSFTSQIAGSSHNAGRDCMQCHAGGGGEAPTFAFGGTLYDGNGKAVVGAEIRVVDANGKAASVYTGPEGNFHSSGTLTMPWHAGARNATSKALMISSLTYGGCNKCHCTGSSCTTAPLHLP